MKLTVIICTHNRFQLLASAIDSLNAAHKPDHCEINILVIANACTDETVSKLQQYRELQPEYNLLPLSFAEEPKAGKSYALNRAVNQVREGYLCFIDDDHRVDLNYFAAIAKAINNFPDTALFCGPIFPDWQGDEPDWIHDTSKYKIYPLPIPYFDLGQQPLRLTEKSHAPLPGGGWVVIHRDVFKRVGLFSEKLGPTGHNLVGSEDTDFFLRALRQGETFYYIPDIVQYHYVDKKRLRLNYLMANCFQRNRSFTLTCNPMRRAVPLYLWRQLFNHMIGTVFSLSLNRTRFYLMRCASTLGEIFGLLQTRKL
ncbi:glycosyltransferase family 2 protein [Methylobacter sp. BBA5.1]|uniref:glycosyltransferase family 2 protein n=1 Tax=Methylobacter sp. BBA5.1 TaxID=1495064 RepID=UPI000566F957|nr:glycosyltransferase [Methylobacter sp. BBA5.1]